MWPNSISLFHTYFTPIFIRNIFKIKKIWQRFNSTSLNNVLWRMDIGWASQWSQCIQFCSCNVSVVKMSSGRSFHVFTTLWLKIHLRRTSLVRSFFCLRECPRSPEVPAIWKKWLHCTPSRKPWGISYLPFPFYNIMSQGKAIGPYLHIQSP